MEDRDGGSGDLVVAEEGHEEFCIIVVVEVKTVADANVGGCWRQPPGPRHTLKRKDAF